MNQGKLEFTPIEVGYFTPIEVGYLELTPLTTPLTANYTFLSNDGLPIGDSPGTGGQTIIITL